MSSLRDIRRQLRSIENIKKITDAMERVAAAHLRRAQAKAEQSRPYVAKLKEILEDLAYSDLVHPLFEQRVVKKTALVVVSADKGLSGSYNSNIFSAADSFLQKYSVDAIDLILFGRKAVDYYRNRQWHVAHRTINWGGRISVHEIGVLSNSLVNDFLSGKYDEIWLLYTHYLSVMRRKIILEKFLNIGRPETHKKRESLNYIYEPNPIEILAELLPRYCFTRIETALYEAYASELGARIVAMQAASKNSEEMMEKLTVVRNKMRQGDITREMIEISSGAEGLK